MPSKPVADDWCPANHRYLMGLIAQTRQVLEQQQLVVEAVAE